MIFTGATHFDGISLSDNGSGVVVRGDAIEAICGGSELAAYVDAGGEVVDLAGKTLMPGFVDAHAHPLLGGLERLRCDLTGGRTIADYGRLIAEYSAREPTVPWILGGGWGMDAFPGGRPTSAHLDAVESGRPVYLPNRDHHSAWVNTKALQLAGIDARTPDPAGGRIERDTSGEPTGLLHESAMHLVEHLTPVADQDDYDAALREAQRFMHSLGITGWQDAMVEVVAGKPSPHHSYLRAQQGGWLTARVSAALWWDRSMTVAAVEAEVARMVELRAQARSSGDLYQAEMVKIMQDGVMETYTAALLEPYLDACGCATPNSGMSFFDEDVLRSSVLKLDAAGFGLHFHALGDRAIRGVLDAIELAQATNGPNDRAHQLAHLQLVDPADIPRFEKLGAVANLQPYWAKRAAQVDELTTPFLGTGRGARQYPFGDLYRSGAPLAMGSDWPVSSADPLDGVHVAVTRRAVGSAAGQAPLGVDQELDLSIALGAYTFGSSAAAGFPASGRLRVGAKADLAVLDRRLTDLPVDEIRSARVVNTYVGGALVYAES
ncbi:amidohydrolase family protein [Nocardia sp. SYP-A9097]|nr:amidohydrolase family protein [Nocardia sp. SYP-A9097]